MRRFVSIRTAAILDSDPLLSSDHLSALQAACASVGLLGFPAPDVIRTLRLHGYGEIVLGGIQITPRGLERLPRDRVRRQPAAAAE